MATRPFFGAAGAAACAAVAVCVSLGTLSFVDAAAANRGCRAADVDVKNDDIGLLGVWIETR